MNSSSVGAIIFDLGKVLIDFSIPRALQQISSLTMIAKDDIHDFLYGEGHEREFETGLISFDEFHQRVERRFHIQVDKLALAEAASDIFTPIQDSLDLLFELRKRYERECQFLLLSNTNEIHWDFIEKKWRVSHYFSHHILSFQVNAMKPDPRIYNEAVRRAQVCAEQCFFVDDVQENVDGAIRAGLDAVRFEGAEKLRAELKLRGLFV